MSWLFSQALVAEYLGALCSGGELSAPLKSTGMPQAYCAPDRMTAFSRLSRFGMTYAPLTVDRGEALLTWYRGAFPVRTYPPQEKGLGLRALSQGSGKKCPESLAKYDRVTHSWKTVRSSPDAASSGFLRILPKWGSMRNGELFPQQTAVLSISGKESGSSQRFATPISRDYKDGSLSEETRQRRAQSAKGKPLSEQIGGKLNPTWVEWLMGWPLEWTALKPLETDKFQSWRQQHGASFTAGLP